MIALRVRDDTPSRSHGEPSLQLLAPRARGPELDAVPELNVALATPYPARKAVALNPIDALRYE